MLNKLYGTNSKNDEIKTSKTNENEHKTKQAVHTQLELEQNNLTDDENNDVLEISVDSEEFITPTKLKSLTQTQLLISPIASTPIRNVHLHESVPTITLTQPQISQHTQSLQRFIVANGSKAKPHTQPQTHTHTFQRTPASQAGAFTEQVNKRFNPYSRTHTFKPSAHSHTNTNAQTLAQTNKSNYRSHSLTSITRTITQSHKFSQRIHYRTQSNQQHSLTQAYSKQTRIQTLSSQLVSRIQTRKGDQL